MLPQHPIEGNLDCRTRAFHSELCFDLAAFRVRPELAQSFQLLRRYHMEHLLAPRDFFYPRIATDFYQSMTTKEVRNPTLIHFTIDGRHARDGSHPNQRSCKSITSAEGELPPVMFLIDAFLGIISIPAALDPKKGSSPRSPYKMSEGFFFGPHHLIMAALLYFEEKPSTSAEPRMAIPISEYRELCRALETLTASQSNLAQELAAIKACQEQMLASQAQQAAILRQLQVHFDLPQAVEPSTDTPLEPHSQPSESHPPEPEAPADPPTEEADPSA
ncbi:hypothetical protein CK203_024391 [Vitis vinifera]|uniref:Uncharacterized protein n=1 Tax=Vitis vinifera TaxID=29760 RepID=A0A438IYB6_VITVI|nr:hypothetical protein CK203_024391 [Vitis vinifera]